MHKKRLIFSIISTALTLFVLSPLHAGVYKWVDKNGQVHYGEQPGNTGAEKITIRQDETTKPRTIKKDEEEGEDKGKEGEKTAEPEVPEIPKKQQRKYCNEAKSDLAEIATRGRLREIDEKGQYTYLTDEQKQKRISAAKKKQREFCR